MGSEVALKGPGIEYFCRYCRFSGYFRVPIRFPTYLLHSNVFLGYLAGTKFPLFFAPFKTKLGLFEF